LAQIFHSLTHSLTYCLIAARLAGEDVAAAKARAQLTSDSEKEKTHKELEPIQADRKYLKIIWPNKHIFGQHVVGRGSADRSNAGRAGMIGRILVAVAVSVLPTFGPALATPGDINTVEGTGTAGFSGDGGAATAARLNYSAGVAVDGAGNVFIADQGNSRIREVAAGTWVINTVAGTGTAGFSGAGGAATAGQLNYPAEVVVDGAGNVFIADTNNSCIRKVAAGTGVISTVAGTGTAGFSGDGGAATAGQLNNPTGMAVDGAGNLFISDFNNYRIRKVAVGTGVISTVATLGARARTSAGRPFAASPMISRFRMMASYRTSSAKKSSKLIPCVRR
jgi:NHL repeat